MKVDESCKVLCSRQYTNDELAQFSTKIDDEYSVNWLVSILLPLCSSSSVHKLFLLSLSYDRLIDNLPGAMKYFLETKVKGDPHAVPVVTELYHEGFPLGFTDPVSKKNFINNHVRLVLYYHENPASAVGTAGGSRFVGFEVEPLSIAHTYKNGALSSCPSNGAPQPQSVAPSKDVKKPVTIVWTYDVIWKNSPIKWSSRWDLYLKMANPSIHWFNIVNSIISVLFLSGVVAFIMVRTVHRDILAYNDNDLSIEEATEESGWKLVHGEVFRPPAYGAFLSILVGSGCQIFFMTSFTILFACLGFLSPANRGSLLLAFLILFCLMGAVAGYFSTRLYKKFKLTLWKDNTIATALFFPGICFVVFFVINLFIWHTSSSGAVPFTTLLVLLVLWFGLSVPLVFAGSFVAFKKPTADPPVRVNSIPRLVLPSTGFLSNATMWTMLAGLLPFCAIVLEIFFIMSSVWHHQIYYIFGVLAVVFVLMVVSSAEVSIVLCYYFLCQEDYHWWWRSFISSGSTAVYVFLYGILYYQTKIDIRGFIPSLVYFGYMGLLSFGFFLLTGAVGYVDRPLPPYVKHRCCRTFSSFIRSFSCGLFMFVFLIFFFFRTGSMPACGLSKPSMVPSRLTKTSPIAVVVGRERRKKCVVCDDVF